MAKLLQGLAHDDKCRFWTIKNWRGIVLTYFDLDQKHGGYENCCKKSWTVRWGL